MSNVKQKKIASSITKLLSEIIKDEVKDEVLKSITITDAKVAGDLSNAKVYFTSLLDMDHEELMKEVNKGAVFLRGQLANRINLRHTPELTFVYDESIEYGNKIEEILSGIKKNDSN